MYSPTDQHDIRRGNTLEGGERDFTSQWHAGVITAFTPETIRAHYGQRSFRDTITNHAQFGGVHGNAVTWHYRVGNPLGAAAGDVTMSVRDHGDGSYTWL